MPHSRHHWDCLRQPVLPPCRESVECVSRLQTDCTASRGGSIPGALSPKEANDRELHPPASAVRPDSLEGSCFLGPKRLRLNFAFFTNQHLDPAFRGFELFTAGFAEAHSFLEELQRAFEGQITGFQLLHYFLQLIQTGLETHNLLVVGNVIRHRLILAAYRDRNRQTLGDLQQPLPSTIVDGNAVPLALALGAPFRIAGDEHLVISGRGRGGFHLSHALLHTRTKFLHRNEAADIDCQKCLTDAEPAAANPKTANFLPHSATTEHSAQNIGQHGKSGTLVASERHQHAFPGFFCIVGRHTARVECPAVRNRGLTVYSGFENLTRGDGCGSHVEQPRSGNRHADRIRAEPWFPALPRRYE